MNNLHFIDPQTGDEYDARFLSNSGDYPDVTNRSAFKVILEITQFGMWGSKSYIIIRQPENPAQTYYYVLESFDPLPIPKCKRKGVS